MTPITFGQMRASGIRRILAHCPNLECGHYGTLSANRWADHLRLADVEARLVCSICGRKGAEVRPGAVPVAEAGEPEQQAER